MSKDKLSKLSWQYRFNGYGTYGIIAGGGQQYAKVIFGIDVQQLGLQFPVFTFRQHIKEERE